jgi:hypothetical protein
MAATVSRMPGREEAFGVSVMSAPACADRSVGVVCV